ncbi:MAG: NUDIX domain-containing protein [Spirochaetales bacterium]|nr:NUDIX domain-containing protein [Spirochaetales bacterium]
MAGIIYEHGQFLVGKRIPGGDMGGRWEFPGGKLDGDEKPEETLVREFSEEMGVTVRVGEFITSVPFSHHNGQAQLSAYRVFIPQTDSLTLTEHTDIAWRTLDEIENLEFVDSDRLLLPALREWVKHAR